MNPPRHRSWRGRWSARSRGARVPAHPRGSRPPAATVRSPSGRSRPGRTWPATCWCATAPSRQAARLGARGRGRPLRGQRDVPCARCRGRDIAAAAAPARRPRRRRCASASSTPRCASSPATAARWLAPLLVEVLFEDVTGRHRALPIGAYFGTSAWQPTTPLAVVANLFSLLPGEYVDVAFRFTPLGDAGRWAIDDVYVDPFRHG